MASEARSKKRKAPAPKASIAKTASNQVPAKKQIASKKAKKLFCNEPADAIKPEKSSRKRAADFFAGDEAEPSAKTSKPKVEKLSAKKRKATSNTSNLIDQLAQTGSAQKRLRKAEVSEAGEGLSKPVKVVANSKLEAAKKSAALTSDYIGDLVGSGQKSLAEDFTGVAEGIVDDKKKAAKEQRSLKKRESKATQEETKARKNSPQVVESAERGSNLPKDNEDENVVVQDSDGSEEIDDQTAALLKSFESSNDESSDEDIGSGEESYKQGTKIPKLPAMVARKLGKVKASSEPGVIYIGHIPHGFYEQEMRSYFNQFGEVTKLRLSRNKKTGRSKHYAFLEFASKEDASITAQTMNNYLMFGHILKCCLVPNEQVHENLWKGANRKFRVVPWAKIEARKLAQPASEEVWGKRIEKEKSRREKKLEKVKSIGYEFDIGTLKAVDDVDVKTKGESSVQEAIEATSEKKKKGKKSKAIENVPKKMSGASENADWEGVGHDDVVERTVTVESTRNHNGQLNISEEVTTKKPRKDGRKKREGKTVGADAVVETTDTSIPAARIAADEIVENISSALKTVGNAVGLTKSTEEAIPENAANEEGTVQRNRKRKAKKDVESKPAKKGKIDEKRDELVVGKENDVKEMKAQSTRKRKDKPGEETNEQPVKEKVVNDKKEKFVKDKKEKVVKEKELKKHKKAVT